MVPIDVSVHAWRSVDGTTPVLVENGSCSNGGTNTLATGTVTNTDGRSWRVMAFAARDNVSSMAWSSSGSVEREDVNVEIEQDAVVIQGQRHQEQASEQSGYYRSERSYGSFYRAIPLPEGTNADSASATFRDGVLKIELDAPRGQRRGRALEIKDGNSQS